MEERNLTIKDIFILIGKHIKSILVVTLAVTIAAVAFVAFKYNKGKQHYTLTYQLSYPGSGNMLYPDSSAVIVTDSITKENLYRVKDSSSSFNSISIDDLATGGALSLSTEIVTLSDSEYERVFKLDVDAKYFSNAEQADKFLKEVAYYPIAHIIEIVGDDKYGQELEKFKNAKTYEEKIVSLNAQKKYLSNEYNKIADMGGSRVSENLAALSLVFTEAQQERLERQIEAYYYKLDTDEAISYANAQKIILQRKYDYNQSKIEETRQKRTDMINSGGGSSISAISSYDDIIASLTIENSDIRDELDEIENLLSAIEEYTVEGTPEYVAKQALDEELNGYFEAIEEETEKLRTTIVGIYTNNSRVVFSGNVSKEGGISLTLAALVGIVGGFVVAAIAICIIFSDSYKAEKYGEVVPANNAGEKEPQIIQPEDEEKLITVSELIGEAPPVLIEESASENTEIAATEEVQDVATEVNVEKAEEEQPAAEEKKAPAKKPAAKKTTSGTAKKPAAKKTTSGTTKKTASTKSAAKTSQE